jgi:uncharacterized protein (TIGR03083 family)
MSKQAMVALGHERDLVLALIDSLTPEEWSMPSDCAGWRVQDVVAHMSAVYKSIAGGPVAREGLRRAFCELYVENMQRLIPQTPPR